ncbi:hypothetical protein GW17_00016465 [Ensete ventricosum]|nr:hypothetical protein GW17_00016465 [Ensete ventricosum]
MEVGLGGHSTETFLFCPLSAEEHTHDKDPRSHRAAVMRTEHHRKRCTCHQRLPSSPLRSMEGSERLPQPMAVCACGCFISAYFSQSSAMGGVQFGTPCILDAGD